MQPFGVGFHSDAHDKAYAYFNVNLNFFTFAAGIALLPVGCPAGDNKWSKTAMRQSFLFTNICPQAPSLNRGDWNEMELACRKWAKNYGGLYIVCGPILYKGKHKTIGRNKVTVPEAFFKVVLCLTGAPKAIGFIYKNTDGNRPKGDYANTVDEVERITGIDFFASLPDDVERKVEAQCDIDAWDLAN